MKVETKKGSLIVVGTGIKVGGHTSISAQAQIKYADIVFAALPDQMGKQWLQSLNSNVFDLTQYYQDNKSRVHTYQDMTKTIVDAVHEGKKVCAVFYGHPGVFVLPSHRAIEQLRSEGYQAEMEPGISAEDCLVADLGIDPGKTGCQTFETTQFLFYQRKLDVNCLLVLWQIGLAGEHSLKVSNSNGYQLGLQVLTQELLKYYPSQHEVIIYEAATIPIFSARIDRMPLEELPNATPSAISTLVIPALAQPELDVDKLAKLGLTVEDIEQALRPER